MDRMFSEQKTMQTALLADSLIAKECWPGGPVVFPPEQCPPPSEKGYKSKVDELFGTLTITNDNPLG